MSQKLLTGEQMVHEGKLHWAIFVPVGLALFLTGGMVMGPRGTVFPLILALAWLFVKIMNYRSAQFLVTNKRVIVQTGWSSRNNFEILLPKIEAINVEQSFGGIGTLTIVGSGGSTVRVKNMKAPNDFKHAIQSQAVIDSDNNLPDAKQANSAKSRDAMSGEVWARQRLKEWEAKGVKRVIFSPAPDCCQLCEKLRGEYPIEKAPLVGRDTHADCRCAYTMGDNCFD